LKIQRDRVCRTLIRKTRTGQQLFPLLGERIKGEGERKTQIPSTPVVYLTSFAAGGLPSLYSGAVTPQPETQAQALKKPG
jgi:hypothetical protein